MELSERNGETVMELSERNGETVMELSERNGETGGRDLRMAKG